MGSRRSTTTARDADQQVVFSPPPGAQPLAARMRPRSLDEVVGQERLLGRGGALRRVVERGHLGSVLLWGPPGSGKTSIARVLADAVGARLVTISAVMSGVAEVRSLVAQARERLSLDGLRTVLFIDEIHRFNKAQQDALLPHVEDGTVTLIGATTENPYFEVNSALLSRMRVYRLEPLTDDQVRQVVSRAIEDAERGLAGQLGPEGGVALEAGPFDHLVGIASGDARQALNILESAISLAESEGIRDADGRVSPRLEDVESAAQQRVLAYDRAGDGHYDTVSAFIKSIRGNDPDAALYWLAAMIAAGEDPRFIARRLIIAASEDVGMADPRALEVAVSAAQALDWVGLPEAAYALAHATVMLAVTAKSNSVGRAYFAAMDDVLKHGSLPVPPHLRSGGPGRRAYRYPHDYEGDDVAQQYLPDKLAGRRYYFPGDQGAESRVGERLDRVREARTQKPRRKPARPGQPESDPMTTASESMRRRRDSLGELAAGERRDAQRPVGDQDRPTAHDGLANMDESH
jgi:putative ATPase